MKAHRIALLVAVVLFAALAGDSFGRAKVDDALCGSVVTASTTLGADLRCQSLPGLIVGAPGITIDLRGFTISGTGPHGEDQTNAGIQNVGFDGVKIVNGEIRDFRWGIVISDDADKNLVENVTVRSNQFDGLIAATGSDQLTLKGVRAVDNGADGISLTDSSGHKVSASAATRNQASGFELINAVRVSLAASTATVNHGDDVLVAGASPGVSIAKMSVTGAGGAGIVLGGDDVDSASVQDVVASGNAYGVYVNGGDDAVLQRVVATGNAFDGVVFEGDADRGALTQATLTGNNQVGVRVCSQCEALITKTVAVGNEWSGFELDGAGAIVKKSGGDGNQEYGIWAASTASDGGGNTAHGNVLADCVNVVCG